MLLSDRKITEMLAIARSRVEGQWEGLRSIVWSDVPPGTHQLEDADRPVFIDELKVRAGQEQRGQLPGDLNTVTTNNREVQQLEVVPDEQP